MDDGAEPQKPTTSPTAHIIYSRPLPSIGGSENECIHTERRSSTGDKDEDSIDDKTEKTIAERACYD